jgi:hypothetical protein
MDIDISLEKGSDNFIKNLFNDVLIDDIGFVELFKSV